MLIHDCLKKLIRRENLDAQTCETLLPQILSQAVSDVEIAALLVLLRAKGETAEELSAFVRVLRQSMIKVETPHRVLDIVGTGGDQAKTINISTGSAILAASCGIKIAKNGNRAVSSLAGSTDVLEALGINIHLTASAIRNCIDEVGIGFCLYQQFQPAIHTLRPLRKSLNVPTLFNLIGPLLNPTLPAHFLLGVYDAALLPLMANTLQLLGTERSFIVHGGGLDEISCASNATIYQINNHTIEKIILTPEEFGLTRCQVTDLQGGNAETNAKILLTLFAGKNIKPAISETLIFNAAIALYLYGHHDNIHDAILHAKENLLSGSALQLLKKWSEYSHDAE